MHKAAEEGEIEVCEALMIDGKADVHAVDEVTWKTCNVPISFSAKSGIV